MTIQLLWPKKILYENILLSCTDAAAYMVNSMDGLSVLNPKMVQVTCLALALHRVAELVRTSYPDVNRLICSAKNIFIEAPQRVQKFKEDNPEIPLPLTPVVTRWGTWLQAASYYCKYYEEIYSVVMSFDESEAESIRECQNLMENIEMKISLSMIDVSFTIITSTINKLEARGAAIPNVIKYIRKIDTALNQLYENPSIRSSFLY